MHAVRVAAFAVAFGLVACPAALAGHGKVGTWQVTTTMGGMGGMPNMANLPPDVQAKMKAHGVQMNGGGGITSKFCMTAEQVNSDHPPMTHHGDCQTQNLKVTGSTFKADVVCTGRMNSKGHVEMTFDSPEHYSGHMTTTMTTESGQTMTHDMTMDAKWLTPNCTIPAGGKGAAGH
jgi:hypothetical protein